MRASLGMTALLGAALLTPALAPAASIGSGKFTVLSVAEGDLFTVDNGGEPVEVRLYGADAPESGQPHFDEAKRYTEQQINGKEVALDKITHEEGGRPVVVVRSPDGVVLHEAMVSEGLAWWDSVNVPENATLKRLNASAIGGGLGLFADASSLAPWDFRKSEGLPPVVYQGQLQSAAEETAPASEEEPKMLKAKGEAKGEETPAYLAEGSAAAAPAPAPGLAMPKIDTGNLDVMSLASKHALRVHKDASGNAIGFTADNISQIPMASQLGFRDGDIVTSVNGYPVRSEIEAFGLATTLKGEKNFSVQVLRNGQPVTININAP